MAAVGEKSFRGSPAFIFWSAPDALARGPRLAAALGCEPRFHHVGRLGGLRLPALVRYVAQARRTLIDLARTRPAFVLVQNPPIFAVLAVAWYARRAGCGFAIDHHTSFLDRRWRLFHWLQKLLSRRAVINLAHNEANLRLFQRWELRNAMLLKSPAVTRDELLGLAEEPGGSAEERGDHAPHAADLAGDGLRVFMVNRFAADDAYAAVIAVARRMPQARFFVTGDPRRVGLVRAGVPRNVVLTGFLPRARFLRLMDACDVVLSLTRRRDTLPWSIRESMALGKPFVASDGPVIRQEFEGYGLFSDHSPEDLERKIGEVVARRAEFVDRMPSYIAADRVRWERDIAELRTTLSGSDRQ